MSRLAARWAAAAGALSDRLFPGPVASVADLGRFVGGRSAYVAQTALYGYLKTRMGTKFPEYFEDLEFSASIRAAAVQAFGSCASDLAIHAVAAVADGGRLDDAAAAALARRCHADALAAGDPGAPRDGFAAAFAARAARTRWAAAQGMEVFAGSCADVVRFAPVTDEFRALDRTIVENSTRFRWIGVRDQLARRLDGGAVAADWRGAAQD